MESAQLIYMQRSAEALTVQLVQWREPWQLFELELLLRISQVGKRVRAQQGDALNERGPRAQERRLVILLEERVGRPFAQAARGVTQLTSAQTAHGDQPRERRGRRSLTSEMKSPRARLATSAAACCFLLL